MQHIFLFLTFSGSFQLTIRCITQFLPFTHSNRWKNRKGNKKEKSTLNSIGDFYSLFCDRIWHKAECGVLKKVNHFLSISNLVRHIRDPFVFYNSIRKYCFNKEEENNYRSLSYTAYDCLNLFLHSIFEFFYSFFLIHFSIKKYEH